MKNSAKYYILFAVLLICCFVADILSGAVSIPVKEIFNAIFASNSLPDSAQNSFVRDIVLDFRLPKAIVALMAGVGLSVCGLQMQTLFRNPLADPYILGISAASGLGVAIFVMGGTLLGIDMSHPFFQIFGIAGAALAGAFLLTMLIISLSNKLKDNLSLLIFGIMAGSVASAIISLLQYFTSAASLKTYVIWTMGSFAGLDRLQLLILAIMVASGLVLSIYNIKDLNALLLGEQHAAAMGLDVKAIKIRILVATTLLAGSVTAFCGPIGFIGIAVPHISRFIFRNANHKILLPASAFTGAIVMLLADIISQMPGSGSVIPINTVAALIGIPVILYIIVKNRV